MLPFWDTVYRPILSNSKTVTCTLHGYNSTEDQKFAVYVNPVVVARPSAESNRLVSMTRHIEPNRIARRDDMHPSDDSSTLDRPCSRRCNHQRIRLNSTIPQEQHFSRNSSSQMLRGCYRRISATFRSSRHVKMGWRVANKSVLVESGKRHDKRTDGQRRPGTSTGQNFQSYFRTNLFVWQDERGSR